jgi:Domain of unknown function (DUF1854)
MSFEDSNPFDVRILNPAQVKLFRSAPGDALVRMTLNNERSWRDVRIARAFPFSDPEHYIGLRTGEDKDIGMMIDLTGMDSESKALIASELEQRYFTPKVEKVNSVLEQHGTSTWEVETDRGARRFIVRNLRDSTSPIGPNRVLITDTEGNRYEFPDVTAYGAKAYRVLSRVQ